MEFWIKKFNTVCAAPSFEDSWQDRLVVVTERRIFIITRKFDPESDGVQKSSSSLQEKDSKLLEIVDSIPMEEIVSIQLEDDAMLVDEDDRLLEERGSFKGSKTDGSSQGRRLSNYLLSASHLLHKSPSACEDPNTTASDIHCLRLSLTTPAAQSARQNFYPSLLRISTSPGGFNHGQTYHFLVRRDNHRQLDKSSEELLVSDDSGRLVQCIATLAERRRREHASETRFARMQQRLQAVWDSVPFNVAVLALITSNFVFTVEQVRCHCRRRRSCHVAAPPQ
jgi:hypothetical protein